MKLQQPVYFLMIILCKLIDQASTLIGAAVAEEGHDDGDYMLFMLKYIILDEKFISSRETNFNI